MRGDLQSKNQQQYMQLAKDSKSQIPRSVSYLAVSGSTREAGAGETFFQKMWLLFRAGSQLFPRGLSWWGSGHGVGKGQPLLTFPLRRWECV